MVSILLTTTLKQAFAMLTHSGLALVVCVAYNYAAKVGIKSCRFV